MSGLWRCKEPDPFLLLSENTSLTARLHETMFISDEMFVIVSVFLSLSLVIWLLYKQIKTFKALFDELRICFCCFELGNGNYLIKAYNHYGDIFEYKYNIETQTILQIGSFKPVTLYVQKQITAYFQLAAAMNKIEL